MSSSFLKPSVTPSTALAARLRARPWYFARSGLSDSRDACSTLSATANLMPGGVAWRILPFGPCTSSAPSTTLTVTPLGSAIGFLPIRDIVFVLPDVAEHFAADARFDRGLAGHHAARRREDAGAEARQHFRHVVSAEVDAAAGAADALDARDQLFAVRAVLQEEPQRFAGARLAVGFVEDLEALDVALVLQDARDVGLDARRRHVHARELRGDGVANPGKHVRDRICH